VKRPTIVILGPGREVISGVSTHVNALLGSPLADHYTLEHFRVGSEGRNERPWEKALRFVFSPLLLLAFLLRKEAQVLHVNTSLNAKAFWRDIAYLCVGKLCGARVLYQVHGGSLSRFRAPRWLLRFTDVVVVLSSVELANFRALLPEQAVEMVPNGIGVPPSREKPFTGRQLTLLYIGRLAPGKGLHQTVEGLRHARQAGVDAHLVIAGSGPEEEALKKRVRAAHLERYVEFAGPCHGEDKAKLYARADALVLASESEGLPYAVLEAMAAGVVPIVTRVGALTDVVHEHEHGLFVPVRDPAAIARAIAALAADRVSLARMGAAARKRAATAYSIERLARDFSSLYGVLTRARAPRTAL
jgi:glycosyltransferase involved in cell wall biosynthesis